MEQQVTWSFNFQVFSQRRLAADYSIDNDDVILESRQCCSAERGLPLERLCQPGFPLKVLQKANASDSRSQTDEGLC